MRNSFKIFAFILAIANILSQMRAGDLPKKQTSASDPEMQTFMFFIDDASGKILQLAEAIPADKFSWRPMDGVRSVAEVFMHIAGTNYFFGSSLGVEMPADAVTFEDEKKITDKSQIIFHLKKSLDFMKTAILELKNESLEDEVEFPFGKFTKRSIRLLLLVHANEHLGQSIAYARSNGVKPPWSE